MSNKAQKKDRVVAIGPSISCSSWHIADVLLPGDHLAACEPSFQNLDLCGLASLLLLLDLQKQRAVDVWQDTSESDCCANECVELLVTADSKLKVARRDALDLEILGGVACKFEDFSGKVLEDSGQIDGGLGADARLLARDGTEVTLYTTAGELRKDAKSARRPQQ